MTTDGKSICVFCSSSDEASPTLLESAEHLGLLIGRKGHRLVYGGVNRGLMAAVSRAARSAGAFVTGVIPQQMVDVGLANDQDNEQIITRDFRTRKAMMETNSDAFIALPGGFGTLEETIEMITMRQLGRHQKPIAIVNIDGFYNHLALFFQVIYREKLAKADAGEAYMLATNPEMAIRHVERHRPDSGPSSRW